MKPDDPAFPHISRPVSYDAEGQTLVVEQWTQGGMSLRCYLAAKAMHARLQHFGGNPDAEGLRALAALSVAHADALIAELNK